MPIHSLLKKCNGPDYRPKSVNVYDILNRVSILENQRFPKKQDFMVKTQPQSRVNQLRPVTKQQTLNTLHADLNGLQSQYRLFGSTVSPQEQYSRDCQRSGRFTNISESDRLVLSKLTSNPWLAKNKIKTLANTTSMVQIQRDNERTIPQMHKSLYAQLEKSGKQKYGQILKDLIDKEVEQQIKTTSISYIQQHQQDDLRASRQFQRTSELDIKSYTNPPKVSKQQQITNKQSSTLNINDIQNSYLLSSSQLETPSLRENQQDKQSLLIIDIIPQPFDYVANSSLESIEDPVRLCIQDNTSYNIHCSKDLQHSRHLLDNSFSQQQQHKLGDTINTIAEELSQQDMEYFEEEIENKNIELQLDQLHDNMTPTILQLQKDNLLKKIEQ
ncbi:hypothetical protein SS50377_24687 [Spironucleus salmonicida]|uniref:Uncharacterized protein n=1 Tax=Spironucleus salmonicida TaxID=348837 RepID=V6LIR6_9EUKA|nr:hypothetical protein SS50377_24687 [Spironucleus salmonicida]|eukprot:EST44495.1 Hypothetical protein SS50377_15493 [Spironucleus salmonicida]